MINNTSWVHTHIYVLRARTLSPFLSIPRPPVRSGHRQEFIIPRPIPSVKLAGDHQDKEPMGSLQHRYPVDPPRPEIGYVESAVRPHGYVQGINETKGEIVDGALPACP